MPGRLKVAQHAVLGRIKQTRQSRQGRLNLYFDPVDGKSFPQPVRPNLVQS
jgi:hypothetical protein